jgi:hypothetical protein
MPGFKPGDPWPCPVCHSRVKTTAKGALYAHYSRLGDAGPEDG